MNSEPPRPRNAGLYGTLRALVRGPVHAVMSQVYGAPAPSAPRELDVLRHVDLLEYAAARRAEHPEVAATLLRREPAGPVWVFQQVFLDRDDNLVRKDGSILGRTIRARAIDDELADLLGDAESLTVELP